MAETGVMGGDGGSPRTVGAGGAALMHFGTG